MYPANDSLTKNAVHVFSIITDALTIKDSDLPKAQALLDFKLGLGKWRHSNTSSDIKFSTLPLTRTMNNLTKIKKPSINLISITIEQEWDTKYICKEIVEPNKTLLIKARCAGSCKSYICEYVRKVGHKIIYWPYQRTSRKNMVIME